MRQPADRSSILILAAALLLAATVDVLGWRSFVQTSEVRRALRKEYGYHAVSVSMHGDGSIHLRVGDAPGDLSPERRLEHAREIARTVRRALANATANGPLLLDFAPLRAPEDPDEVGITRFTLSLSGDSDEP